VACPHERTGRWLTVWGQLTKCGRIGAPTGACRAHSPWAAVLLEYKLPTAVPEKVHAVAFRKATMKIRSRVDFGFFSLQARAIALAFASTLCFGQPVITTVAGSDFVFPGTPLPALNAPLGANGLPFVARAVDASGNVILADQGNNRVFKLSPAGILSVVAGNGLFGFSGDGGPATAAALGDPGGVAVDRAGNIYIGDASNAVVRRVSPDGIITTIAGNGTRGSSGDGGPALAAQFQLPQ
jgi:hypothetical protein